MLYAYDQRVDGGDIASRADQRVEVEFADEGALVGIVTLDDLLPAIAEELRELADIAAPEPRRRAWRTPKTLAAAANF